jgi:hypothetical protein
MTQRVRAMSKVRNDLCLFDYLLHRHGGNNGRNHGTGKRVIYFLHVPLLMTEQEFRADKELAMKLEDVEENE